MFRKIIIALSVIGLFSINPAVYSQTIETGGNSVEDSLLGGANKPKAKSKPAANTTKSKPAKKKATAKQKSKTKKYGPKIDTVAVDGINLKLTSCNSSTGNLNCKGFINASDAINFSLQCYSGSYLVADGREVGCQSVRISDIQNWSYVAVGLSPSQQIPFDITFSNANSSIASAINVVVSTPSQRNTTLSFKNINLR